MPVMEQNHPLVAQSHAALGVTYSEVRDWASWLNTFTASDMADAMAVSVTVAENAIRALLFHGICENTGDEIDGETIISYKPLPPGPNEHPTFPPEWRTCFQEILTPRGMLVRQRSAEGRARSTAGVGHRIALREKRYKEMERARDARR